MTSRWQQFWERMLPIAQPGRHEPDLRLFAPSLLRSPLRPLGQEQVDGVVIGSYAEMGWLVTDKSTSWVPVHAHPVATLSRPLPRLLVGNDFFVSPGKLTAAPPVSLATTPADVDPYDGRTWRVHADSPGFAAAVLDRDAWRTLEELGKRRAFTVWVDGCHVVGADPSDRHAVARLTRLLERRIADGVLDAWPAGPDAASLPDLGLFPGTSWRLHRVEPEPRRVASLLVPDVSVDAQLDGSVDTVEFTALRISDDAGYGAPLYAPPSRGVTHAGLVLLRLPQPVGRVSWRRDPLLDRSNVHTEWLDFDRQYQVRADDPELGHAVTHPLMMQYLVDHQVPRLDAVADWLVTRVPRLDQAQVDAAVRMLDGARRLLPRWLDGSASSRDGDRAG